MLFNSIEYFLFLPLFFALYWTLAKYSTIRTRNIFILAGSYVFYGWWDWRYLILIIISSFIDYSVGIGISRNESKKIKKRFLYLSLAANLGMLGYFKYSNFFIENLGEYPYKKLANVQSKTRFGGMENANTIFYPEGSVTGKRKNEVFHSKLGK